MLDKISEDIKTAMKAKDRVRLDALRFLKKLLIENKTAKKPVSELDIIAKYSKQLQDSVEAYPDGSELQLKAKEEIKVVHEYLPQQLTEDEVLGLINEIKEGLEQPNLGQVMKELSDKIKGRFDGKKASELVRQVLS